MSKAGRKGKMTQEERRAQQRRAIAREAMRGIREIAEIDKDEWALLSLWVETEEWDDWADDGDEQSPSE